MTDEKQLQRFRQAVEDKNETARAGAEGPPSPSDGAVRQDEEPELHDPGRPRDTRDERAKSTGHGKKTADKWNQ